MTADSYSGLCRRMQISYNKVMEVQVAVAAPRFDAPPGSGFRPRKPLGSPSGSSGTAPDTETEVLDPEKGRVLRCVQCRYKITGTSSRLQVNGNHSHVFCNPHGLVYELGCFSSARGCGLIGSPSAEFSWFPGYSWRVAVCSRCHLHMGWSFQPLNGAGGFWGLILSHLVEEEDE